LTKSLIYDFLSTGKKCYTGGISQRLLYSYLLVTTGEIFEEPEKITEITRTVDDIQILAQHNNFVIAIKEWITRTGQHHRRLQYLDGYMKRTEPIYRKGCTSH
jgi:hypothetical protein